MKKLFKLTAVVLLLAAAFWLGTLAVDRHTLGSDVIRLHVVANSDSQEDQALKLQVRDAVTAYLQDSLEAQPDAAAARAYLAENLPELEDYVNTFIEGQGFSQKATVTLTQEPFGLREYDTFTLPSGVYESLRITIGQGQGRNWWCVVFPSLCVSAVDREFAEVSAGAGFSQPLTGAISGTPGYEVRFFLLDLWGQVENFFFRNRN